MKKNFIAIKLKGFSHWLWFKTANVVRELGRFQGKDGWGCEGALSECDVDEDLIEGEIHSDSPQTMIEIIGDSRRFDKFARHISKIK